MFNGHMTENRSIAAYSSRRLMQIIRLLHMERYRRVLIDAPPAVCIEKLGTLDGVFVKAAHYTILLETSHLPHRFMLFSKHLNRDYASIIGTIVPTSDDSHTEMHLAITPSPDIIPITLLALVLAVILIVPVFIVLPLGGAPLWCYLSWGTFALFPVVAYFLNMLSFRTDILNDFETLYLKTFSYQFAPTTPTPPP